MVGEQFERLFLQPLLGIKQGPTATMVIVIDVLDECDREGDIKLMRAIVEKTLKDTFAMKLSE